MDNRALPTPVPCKECGKPGGGHDWDCSQFKAYWPEPICDECGLPDDFCECPLDEPLDDVDANTRGDTG